MAVASYGEAQRLADALELKPVRIDGTAGFFASADGSVFLITPGVDSNFMQVDGKPIGRPGKVSAGVATAILLERYHPDVLINVGTAAGVAARGVDVGDIVVADAVTNGDIVIPLAGYDAYGTRRIRLGELDVFDSVGLPYVWGTVSSSESFSNGRFYESKDIVAHEMEAAGVVQAAQIMGYVKPVYVIKALTDKESQDSSPLDQATDYERNGELAMKALTAFLRALILAIQKS